MNFIERLNAILPRITEDNFFIKGRGLGNEIPFYVFDYPPEEELTIRDHVSFILDPYVKSASHLKVLHLKLFDLMVEYLRERGNLIKPLH